LWCGGIKLEFKAPGIENSALLPGIMDDVNLTDERNEMKKKQFEKGKMSPGWNLR